MRKFVHRHESPWTHGNLYDLHSLPFMSTTSVIGIGPGLQPLPRLDSTPHFVSRFASPVYVTCPRSAPLHTASPAQLSSAQTASRGYSLRSEVESARNAGRETHRPDSCGTSMLAALFSLLQRRGGLYFLFFFFFALLRGNVLVDTNS